ncbi:MAG: hypothetical protein FWC09_01255 [Lachnospiraceae bacterium]|nr:hypothetical protein [Lachnospiraceae bacterium]
MAGKEIRLKRIFKSDDCVFAAIDHGITSGSIEGMESFASIRKLISNICPDAFILHKGVLKALGNAINNKTGIFMHLSGGLNFSQNKNSKILVGTVEEALYFGADGVSVHINLEPCGVEQMLSDLAHISNRCETYGLPLLTMVYPPSSIICGSVESAPYILHGIRISAELGADIVKIPYFTGMEEYAEEIKGNEIKVLVAGGEWTEERQVMLAKVQTAMEAGCLGVCMGRNIFQSENPGECVKQLRNIMLREKLL